MLGFAFDLEFGKMMRWALRDLIFKVEYNVLCAVLQQKSTKRTGKKGKQRDFESAEALVRVVMIIIYVDVEIFFRIRP